MAWNVAIRQNKGKGAGSPKAPPGLSQRAVAIGLSYEAMRKRVLAPPRRAGSGRRRVLGGGANRRCLDRDLVAEQRDRGHEPVILER